MSATSTPWRPRPALVIPGNDDKGLYDVKSMSMPCHGLPTPPQSALESRRPSLQFSAMPDYGHAAGPNMGAYSVPSTPVRSVSRHGEAYSNRWSEQTSTATSTPTGLLHSLSGTHLSHPLIQSNFMSEQTNTHSYVDSVEPYVPAVGSQAISGYHPSSDATNHAAWMTHRHAQTTLAAGASTDLGPSLFALSHHMRPENGGHQPLANSGYGCQTIDHTVQSLHHYDVLNCNTYNQPQVISPSQLSPQEDLPQQQYHAMTYYHEGLDAYSSSFGSSAGGVADYDMVPRSSSPISDYFDQTDEEGFTDVKPEARQHTFYTSPARPAPRKRATKKSRSAALNIKYSGVVGNIHIDYVEGASTEDKKFACEHMNENGTKCDRKFRRAEHLKRHVGRHSSHRPFPCPLPDCGKEIQRPDNAADHFKTHLRPTKKGKRNKHCDWVHLRRAITQHYGQMEDGPKRAKKLLHNLQSWIEKGMKESPSQRRGTSQHGDTIMMHSGVYSGMHDGY